VAELDSSPTEALDTEPPKKKQVERIADRNAIITKIVKDYAYSEPEKLLFARWRAL
jgi:hemerythrin superfamily protein